MKKTSSCAGAEVDTVTSSTSSGFWDPPVTVPDHGELQFHLHLMSIDELHRCNRTVIT